MRVANCFAGEMNVERKEGVSIKGNGKEMELKFWDFSGQKQRRSRKTSNRPCSPQCPAGSHSLITVPIKFTFNGLQVSFSHY
jgi:hypothetical protein